ncbi:hypothetical protein POVWA2_013690 [Plasmodium ovale wallikeri]|uniref:Uncharacterized protein n=1 Tax=Plasmodium ovale wallikeri TaxID=864142 RepID=A0A1A8YNQ3_PLAOA|nr:hypothetical protein POVWA2_013690 [Plasmodium ovale wallikeri]
MESTVGIHERERCHGNEDVHMSTQVQADRCNPSFSKCFSRSNHGEKYNNNRPLKCCFSVKNVEKSGRNCKDTFFFHIYVTLFSAHLPQEYRERETLYVCCELNHYINNAFLPQPNRGKGCVQVCWGGERGLYTHVNAQQTCLCCYFPEWASIPCMYPTFWNDRIAKLCRSTKL